MEVNLSMFCYRLLVYVVSLEILLLKREDFNPDIILCLSQARTDLDFHRQILMIRGDSHRGDYSFS
jgi:hypothetical protein